MVSQTALQQVLKDIQSGQTPDYVKKFFVDDPEMLKWVHQQEKTNGQTDDKAKQETAQA